MEQQTSIDETVGEAVDVHMSDDHGPRAIAHCLMRQESAVAFYGHLHRWLDNCWKKFGANAAFRDHAMMDVASAKALCAIARDMRQVLRDEIDEHVAMCNEHLGVLDDMNEYFICSYITGDLRDDLVEYRDDVLQALTASYPVRAFVKTDNEVHVYCHNSRQPLLTTHACPLVIEDGQQDHIHLSASDAEGSTRALTSLYAQDNMYSAIDALLLLHNYVIIPILHYYAQLQTSVHSPALRQRHLPDSFRLAYWLITAAPMQRDTAIAAWLKDMSGEAAQRSATAKQMIALVTHYRTHIQREAAIKACGHTVDDAFFATIDASRAVNIIMSHLLSKR